MPSISVVIPVHNRQDLVSCTLDSVQAQTFTDWECIVVDDHSSDNSFAVAQRYAKLDKRFRAVCLPDSKRYQNAARNYGLSIATGEFVNFLDHDDLITQNKLAVQVAAFQREPSLDMVACRHISFTSQPLKDLPELRFAPQSSWLDVVWMAGYLARYGGLWQTACSLWRVKAIYAIGCWNENARVWDDPEINVRAMLRGLKILRLEQILVFFREDTPGKITLQRHDVRYGLMRKDILAGWGYLERAGQGTKLRRRMCSTRFYHMARNHARSGHLMFGLWDWCRNTGAIKVGWHWRVYGAVLLVTGHFRFCQRLFRRLRPRFFAHLNELPPALADTGVIPVNLIPHVVDET